MAFVEIYPNNKSGKKYTTYMLVRIDGEQPPFDVICK